jgi:ABC-type nickel/cobalt efflux system permease component RcnA
MENLGLALIFWYGVLHAFGPDHLTAIADFSIGKNKKKTMLITVLFALGHGLSLFIFAKILQHYHISEKILGYGDSISSSVILGIGAYLLYMVFTDRIQLHKHMHEGKEHIHIWFGNGHAHNSTDTTSAFTIGVLMGIGGVRGMLVTLGTIEAQSVDYMMVFAFTLGVMSIFVGFGIVILYINQNLLNSKQNLRRVFATAGVISLVVGSNMLLG